MDRLPTEIITDIFKAAQQRSDAGDWWDSRSSVNESNKRMLYRLSLVCKSWHQIAVKANEVVRLDDASSRRLLHRSIRSGAEYRITHLHLPLEALVYSRDTWRISPTFVGMLKAVQHTLIGLSVPAALLDHTSQTSILHQIASNVLELRIFGLSSGGIWRNISFTLETMSHHPELLSILCRHPELLSILSWSKAKYIHLNAKLQCLELDKVMIKDIDYSRIGEQACKASKIRLNDIQSVEPVKCGELFPSVQSLELFGTSSVDRSIPIATLVDLILMYQPDQPVLDIETLGIIRSPNLITVYIMATQEIVGPWPLCWTCTSTLSSIDINSPYAGFFLRTDRVCSGCGDVYMLRKDVHENDPALPGYRLYNYEVTKDKSAGDLFGTLMSIEHFISEWKAQNNDMDDVASASEIIRALHFTEDQPLPFAMFVRWILGVQSDDTNIYAEKGSA